MTALTIVQEMLQKLFINEMELDRIFSSKLE